MVFEKSFEMAGKRCKSAPVFVLGRIFTSNEFLVDLSGRKNEAGLSLKGQSFMSFLN